MLNSLCFQQVIGFLDFDTSFVLVGPSQKDIQNLQLVKSQTTQKIKQNHRSPLTLSETSFGVLSPSNFFDTSLISSFRNRNLFISDRNSLPHVSMHSSSALNVLIKTVNYLTAHFHRIATYIQCQHCFLGVCGLNSTSQQRRCHRHQRRILLQRKAKLIDGRNVEIGIFGINCFTWDTNEARKK